MQRLFSSFPNGRPGKGLVLLRLTLAGGVFADAAAGYGSVTLLNAIPEGARVLAAALIVLGAWTPVAGAMLCLLQLAMLLTGDAIALQLLRAAVALALALLGPGAWSFDARRFGRRRIDIRELRQK